MNRISIAVVVMLFARMTAAGQQPTGPALHIDTENGQTIFHIGERIPLGLSFTGPDDNSYAVLLSLPGRSGIPFSDICTVIKPGGWADPLRDNYMFEGGAYSISLTTEPLSSKPVLLKEDLNDWVRFDEPGTYRVVVTSHRVGRARKTENYYRKDGSIELKSNELQFMVIPATPAWQKETYDRATREIATTKGWAEGNYEPQPKRKAAIADLRFLATPAAIQTLSENLQDESDMSRDAALGLIGLSRSMRDTALQTMNRLMDDPRFPIPPQFLDTMAELQMDDVVLTEANTVAPEANAVALKMNPWMANAPRIPSQAAVAEFQRRKAQANTQDWEAVASVLLQKQGAASTITAQTLAADEPADPSITANAEVGEVYREAFAKLSPGDQSMALLNHWDALRSRELLPEIRALAKGTVDDRQTLYTNSGETTNVAIALQRWYEFEPEDAMVEIQRRLNRPNPQLSAADLSFLPKQQTFPQFEALWMQGLEEGRSIHEYEDAASLLIRFGTGAVSGQMAILATEPSSDYACNRPDEAMAYLLRFDPDTARTLLLHPVAKIPVSGADCSVGQYDFIASYVQSPILVQAAVHQISNPSSQVVDEAVQFLTKYGDESSRKPILQRFLQWSDYMAIRPAAPEEGDKDPALSADTRERELGDTLVRGLLGNQGWIPDDDLKNTVLEKCSDSQTCDEVKRLEKPDFSVEAPGDLYVIGPFMSPTEKLFEQKIDQFPKGTIFRLSPMSMGDQHEQSERDSALAATFASHGMKLVPE